MLESADKIVALFYAEENLSTRELTKRYQHQRDALRDQIVQELLDIFPPENLFAYNPLREEDGEEKFNRVYQTRMTRALATLWHKRYGEHGGKKGSTHKKRRKRERNGAKPKGNLPEDVFKREKQRFLHG